MESTEGEGSSEPEMQFTEIETAAEFFDSSVVFHVVKDTIGFILYMHQQIPSILQDISLEFDLLRTEYEDLEVDLAKTEMKERRQHIGRMREEVILVLGASPIRPQHVYQLCFSHSNPAPIVEANFVKGKTAEGLSRKAIRALITKGAGSSSYPGPTKLFLMVKAPTSFNLPLHFLPKRDFRYSKKIVPFRLRFRCRTQGLKMDDDHSSQTGRSKGIDSSNDLIWFQCRHAIKGIPFKTPEEEE
ncbi:F15k9.21, putative isoform 2 [Hibiscus syriacus]|uniref:F15k9.21, putative isoform 2 n=1 Tax=Hibiscus syriacus TaxID=106335 RepID=A0A6A2XME1_HIBSY|nr:F15k9.21, putative isoform 2 [Hibiscus syriacus]